MSAEARLEADSIQLHFCQRCGISIPVSDIESGRAQAAPGGFICLACSYQTAGGEAAPLPPVASGGELRRDGGLRVLAAIALLYVVGATTFLLIREASREAPVLDLSGVATARDLQTVARSTDGLDGAVREGITTLSANDDVLRGDLRAALDRVAALETFAKEQSVRQQSDDDAIYKAVLKLAEQTVGLRSDSAEILDELRRLRKGVEEGGVGPVPTQPPVQPVTPTPGEPETPKRSPEELAREKQVREYISVLEDKKASEQKRYDAAVNLGDLRDPLAVDPLTTALRDEDDTLIKRAAAWALGRLGKAAVSAIPVLIAEIGGKEPYVGYTCVNSLKAITKEALGAPVDVGKDFDPTMGVRDRKKVQQLWQEWWEANEKNVSPG